MKVNLDTGTGHDDDPDNPIREVFTFATKAEAEAFILGVNKTTETTEGWVDGWAEATLVADECDCSGCNECGVHCTPSCESGDGEPCSA